MTPCCSKSVRLILRLRQECRPAESQLRPHLWQEMHLDLASGQCYAFEQHVFNLPNQLYSNWLLCLPCQICEPDTAGLHQHDYHFHRQHLSLWHPILGFPTRLAEPFAQWYIAERIAYTLVRIIRDGRYSPETSRANHRFFHLWATFRDASREASYRGSEATVWHNHLILEGQYQTKSFKRLFTHCDCHKSSVITCRKTRFCDFKLPIQLLKILFLWCEIHC